MKRFLSNHLLAGAYLGVALAAQAAPLQRADVIGNAFWVLHVDADALRPTVVGQHLLAELDKPEPQKKLAAFQAIFSIDLRKELHGVTLYGMSKAEADGVLLVYADFDATRLTTLAEGAREHKSALHGKHTIHSWVDEKKKEKDGVKPRTYAAINSKVIVFGQKESRVAEALDVLDRAKPSLATSPEFGKLGQGRAFIQGAARKLDVLAEGEPNAAVLRQARTIALDVGESQQRLEAALTVEAGSEEVAMAIESVGRGLLALLTLQKDKSEAQKLVQGLGLQQDGASVVVKLSLPADDVIGLLKAADARKRTARARE